MGGEYWQSDLRVADERNEYGQYIALYTHPDVFSASIVDPDNASTFNTSVQKHPFPPNAHAYRLLSNLKFNLDGKRLFHQRVWIAPLTVAARFAQIQNR